MIALKKLKRYFLGPKQPSSNYDKPKLLDEDKRFDSETSSEYRESIIFPLL